MSSADAVAVVLWTGATMYAVFGGADFGAGLWSLLAGGGERGRRPRELIDWAIGPVWEANHVWLIFVLVVLWTGFSSAFEAIFSTLFIPLEPRRARHRAAGRRVRVPPHRAARRGPGRSPQVLFGLASLLTPFFMGTVVGAIAGGRVPVGNATGDAVTSWLNPLSLVIGALFVATSAYLSAVFLVSDARRAGAPDLERYFGTRALVAAARHRGARGRRPRRAAQRRALRLRRPHRRRAAARDPLAAVRASRCSCCSAAAPGAARAPLAVGAVAADDLGLGHRAAPLPAAARPHDRRRGRAERDAHQRADRLRRRRRARRAVDRAAVHARPAEPRRGDLATGPPTAGMTVAWPIRSVIAGAAGTATMTLAYACERRLRRSRHGPLDYDDSLVPGQIVAMVMHLPHVTDRGDRELGFLLRWSYGSAFGLLHGELRRTIGEPWASAAFGGTADHRDHDAVPPARPHAAAVALAARHAGDQPGHPCRLRRRRRRGRRHGPASLREPVIRPRPARVRARTARS